MVSHPVMPPGSEGDELVLAYWSPIYLSYCAAMGDADPTDRLVVDARTWPADKLTGFLQWLVLEYRQWAAQHNVELPPGDDQATAQRLFRLHRSQFSLWLQERHLFKQPHLSIEVKP